MRTLNTKVLIIWEQGDYDKACSTLEYSINTTEQMGNNYLVDLFDFSLNYARCLHEKGSDTRSKEYYSVSTYGQICLAAIPETYV